MREILFRGKRKDNGKWVEGFYHCVTDNYTPKNIHYITTFKRIDNGEIVLTGQFEVIPETVGEFTGLVNVGGRKIFEGDIAQWENRRFVVRRECDTLGGSWSDTAYILDEIGVSGGMSFEDTIDELNCEICVEIIGNIHDDPELLKGE